MLLISAASYNICAYMQTCTQTHTIHRLMGKHIDGHKIDQTHVTARQSDKHITLTRATMATDNCLITIFLCQGRHSGWSTIPVKRAQSTAW